MCPPGLLCRTGLGAAHDPALSPFPRQVLPWLLCREGPSELSSLSLPFGSWRQRSSLESNVCSRASLQGNTAPK